MNYKWRNIERYCVRGFGILIVLLWAGNIAYRFFLGTIPCYFVLPLSSLINITLAFFIAYVFSQKQTDFRKKKDILSNIIDKIIVDLSDHKMYDISSQNDVRFILMRQKSIDNRINLIKEFEKDFDITAEIKYVEEESKRYWAFISENVEKIQYLQESKKELQNFIQNIINKLECIVVKINKS